MESKDSKSSHYLSEGRYGCVYQPPLKCKQGTEKGDKKAKGKMVSKLTTKDDAEHELESSNFIFEVPGADKYFVNVNSICEPEETNDLEQCEPTKKEEYDDIRMLTMPYGGITLQQVKEKMQENLTENFIRVLLSLSEAFTNPVASDLKAEFAKHIAEIAGPKDDPVYVELIGMYVGKILYDFETRATSKLFRVSAIQFVRSFTSTRHSCWEATCEPVQRDPRTGHFGVPHDVKVPGSNVTLTHALQGYCLAEYPNGIDGEPSYLPWVQQYIDHFRNVILPKYPSFLLDSPSNRPEDSPSKTHKDSPSLARTPKRRTRPQARATRKFQTGH
jgi:hypothetical protein